MPAATAFWTSSNPARPDTTRAGLGDRIAGQEAGAGDLVDGVVATHVLADDEQLAVGRRESGRVHPAGAGEDLLRSRSRSGRRRTTSSDGSGPFHGFAWGTSRTAEIESLPQTPQAEPAPTPPVPVCRWVGSTRGGADSVSVTTLNSCSGVRSASVQ